MGKTAQHDVASKQDSPSRGITEIQGKIIIVLLLVGLGWPIFRWITPTQKWEYMTLDVQAEAGLAAALGANYEKIADKTIPDMTSRANSLGAQGWELVAAYLEIQTKHPNFGKEEYVSGLQPNVRPQKLVCIFKRPKKF
jgi:hypothetical protein